MQFMSLTSIKSIDSDLVFHRYLLFFSPNSFKDNDYVPLWSC